MQKITVSGLENVEGAVTDDGGHVWLRLTNKDSSMFQTALNEDALNRVLGLMLNLVQELAKKSAPPEGATRQITAMPIPAARLGVARGRSETEAMLAVQLGPVSLTFALELSVLAGMCDALQRVEREGRQSPKH